MKAVTPQEVRMDLIVLDAGTKQRSLDQGLVKKYQALMEDAVEFPPIEIIRDAEKYILVDGFHRFQCHENLNKRTIRAFVTEGSLRDAIWESFSANKLHGQPRAKGAAAEIINKILTDSSWAKKTITAIAKHTGVTRQYVQILQAKLKKKDKVDSKSKNDVSSVNSLHEDSEPTEPEKPTLQRSDTIAVTSSKGKEFERKRPEVKKEPSTKKKKKTKPKIITDRVGQPIPKDLIETYQSREIIVKLMNDLAAIKAEVKKHIDTRDPAFTLLNTTAFETNYGNLRGTLKATLPHAVCCYCGGAGKKCTACGGFGFLNLYTHNAAPKDLKPKKK